MALKSETIGLAVSLELPLLIVDIQRGGPSTGLPTKTEQADLLQAMFGRNGEAPVPVVAPADARPTASTPRWRRPGSRSPTAPRSSCSPTATSPTAPSRGGSRTSTTCPTCGSQFATGPNHTLADGTEVFWPYKRDPQTLARPWAIPGTPGLEHRIGGIEKQDGTGNISYDPANHDFMVRTRQAKIDGIDVPDLEVDDPRRRRAPWSWAGARPTARSPPPSAGCARPGSPIAQAHLRHLNPFPRNLGEVLQRYDKVVVPEMNLGQLATLIRAKYLVDAQLVQPGPRHAVQGRAARDGSQGGHR